MNDIISNLYESWFSKGYPQDWKISRIKDLISLIRKEKNKSEETPVISLTINGVKLKNNLSEGMNPETYIGHQLVYPGDLVICLRDLDGPLLVGISEHYGCTSNLYVILQMANQNIEYYNHVFKTMDFLRVIDDFSYGMRHSYNISQFGQLRLPVPQRYIQDRIVKELNTLEVKINQLINNQQQQIEKLKEYKQSLISEVVTKGLDPNVEFKDSGIEIIDKIPKDWGIIKMKYLGESRNGLTYNPSDMVDDGEGILVLRSSNVRDGKLIFDDNVYLKMQIKEDLMLKNGDILICSRNGSRDLIGKNAIIENVGLCSFGAFMMVFRVSKANPKYIKYILDSFIFNYYLGTYLTATINQLTLSNFNNMKVIYTTNSDEQEKIISYLDEKCQKIDQLIELKAKKLLNLEEFKKSLIYEYVTGKKEVF